MHTLVAPAALIVRLTLGAAAPPAPGVYDAWLESRGGRVTFALELAPAPAGASSGSTVATIVNGRERIAVANTTVEGDALVIPFEPYSASLRVIQGAEPGTLEGAWTRRRAANDYVSIAFHAQPPRPLGLHPPGVRPLPERWAITFANDDETDIGVFTAQPDGRVFGTILTTTGDSRYLHGSFDGTSLELCSFGGSGASLIRARLSDDGSALTGESWSGATSHRTFTAVADPDAALPDDLRITRATARPDLTSLQFTDEHGRRVALSTLIDGPAVIELFGTWCPNSNDAASFMNELQATYGPRGLDVVGLAFEGMGDEALDRACIAAFRAHHASAYPILLAGESDKAEASKQLPFIDRVHAFPSAILIDRKGRVRAIHTGYSGPATDEAHESMKRRIIAIVEEMLDD